MEMTDQIASYLHGRMTSEERAAFETRLDADPHLAAELAAMKAASSVLGSDNEDPSRNAEGWARLSEAISAGNNVVPANVNAVPRWVQFAGVAAAAVLAWQVIAVPFFTPPADDGFVPASMTSSDVTLRIAFENDATLSEILRLLEASGGQISDGPSATGLFTIFFGTTENRDTAQNLFEARDDLVSVVSRP